MLVVSGMQFALLGRGEAGCRTGFEHRGEKAEIRRALPRHDTTGCVAGIGAVEAESNDAEQLLHIPLAQTGVRAGGAAGGAIETLFDTTEERAAIQAGRLWVEFDDLLKSHVRFFLV